MIIRHLGAKDLIHVKTGTRASATFYRRVLELIADDVTHH
jgi:hypothetical protein